ncbi:BCCT family betaine/carnitine transporter [Salsuginibacillus halophilus]|uniref:BCCT family betaine/carnitine transporter n=1 Tax=Salsuginibacillus halophilus TaxID=517424 RepID=A0A2P8HI52_9BACI|nr:BCCT family transporter [Salsuginibacillus halophilus]PSL45898.1 BCCT family betaine/carnitine transporter [Salsuginibacillus halophilus]
MDRKIMDWPTFIGALLVLFSVAVPLVLFPDFGDEMVTAANTFVTESFGNLYLLIGMVLLVFLLYIAFSRYGRIVLGSKESKPEFNTLTWAGMLFAAGIGSSVLYWGTIEWAFYYQGPPFGAEPGSNEAIEWATTYGLFHWGPIAWAIYCLPALPIAYFFYVRRRSVLKVSEACRPILKGYTDGPVGKLVDVLFMIGLLGGAGTTMGLATPLIGEGVSYFTGIEPGMGLYVIVLLGCTAIFAISSYTGLRRGIRHLSNINLWLSFILLGFILVVGPTLFITDTMVNSVGRLLDNFFQMAMWTEPFKDFANFESTGFPEAWTIFYWAWWLVYAPFVGLFVARISKGRTIREMVLGTLVYGTIGCLLYFGILGNFGLYLELTGQYSPVDTLNNVGTEAAIIGTVAQMPLSPVFVGIFVVLAIIFLATTFDSGSYILASVCQNYIDDEPERWNRLFWAVVMALPSMVLLLIGGGTLDTLQTASIVAGFPLIFIMTMLAFSFTKAIKEDMPKSFGSKYYIYREDMD